MIGENIKRLRLAKNLTQTELGKAIGVAGGTIQRYESGDISPPLDRLEQIAEALGVEVTDLIVDEKSFKEAFQENFSSAYYRHLDNISVNFKGMSIKVSDLNLSSGEDNPESVEVWAKAISKKYNIPFPVAFTSYPLFFKLKLKNNEELFHLIISYLSKFTIYHNMMFDFFYDVEYSSLVKDQKMLLNTINIYSNQNETLKREVKALERRIKDQDTMLAEYENLVSNHISGIAKKETLTESDIEELKKDFEDKFQQQQDAEESDR